jgi:hypothetical protein
MPIRTRIGIKMEIPSKKRCRSTTLVDDLSLLVSGEEGGAGGDGEDGGEAQAARQAETPHDQGPAGGGLGGAGSHGGQGTYLLGYTCGLTSGGPGRASEEVSGSGCGGGWALPHFAHYCAFGFQQLKSFSPKFVGVFFPVLRILADSDPAFYLNADPPS